MQKAAHYFLSIKVVRQTMLDHVMGLRPLYIFYSFSTIYNIYINYQFSSNKGSKTVQKYKKYMCVCVFNILDIVRYNKIK